jgi:hypothetical protein
MKRSAVLYIWIWFVLFWTAFSDLFVVAASLVMQVPSSTRFANFLLPVPAPRS